MKNPLVNQYRKEYEDYQHCTSQACRLLTNLLNEQQFHIHMVSGRTKSSTSLAEKILKNQNKYHDLSEVTDLCGIRIITYYEDEVDQVAAFIKKQFTIDEENSIDKRTLLSAECFGYTSLHLILDLPMPQPHGIGRKNYKIELQIRSILQHTWAEIEHSLVYKRKETETYETRRQFSRLASLLELADLEFLKLRDRKAVPPASTLHYFSKIMRMPRALLPITKQISKKYAYPSLAANYILVISAICSVASGVYFGQQMMYYAAKLSTLLTNV